MPNCVVVDELGGSEQDMTDDDTPQRCHQRQARDEGEGPAQRIHQLSDLSIRTERRSDDAVDGVAFAVDFCAKVERGERVASHELSLADDAKLFPQPDERPRRQRRQRLPGAGLRL